jgi:hypothetical protein
MSDSIDNGNGPPERAGLGQHGQQMRGKSEKPQDRSFTMRVNEEWEMMIEELRALERPVMTRAAYVKKLTQEAYAEKVGKRRRPKASSA